MDPYPRIRVITLPSVKHGRRVDVDVMNHDLGMARWWCFVNQPVTRITPNPTNAAGEAMEKRLVFRRLMSLYATYF